jgi:hypothetical protein
LAPFDQRVVANSFAPALRHFAQTADVSFFVCRPVMSATVLCFKTGERHVEDCSVCGCGWPSCRIVSGFRQETKELSGLVPAESMCARLSEPEHMHAKLCKSLPKEGLSLATGDEAV